MIRKSIIARCCRSALAARFAQEPLLGPAGAGQPDHRRHRRRGDCSAAPVDYAQAKIDFEGRSRRSRGAQGIKTQMAATTPSWKGARYTRQGSRWSVKPPPHPYDAGGSAIRDNHNGGC